MTDHKSYFTKNLKSALTANRFNIDNPIYVFIGLEQYVNIEEFNDWIIDRDTFDKYDNAQTFDHQWFGKVFGQIMSSVGNPSLPFTIISLPQLGYLSNYLAEGMLDNRIVLVSDGIRRILPIDRKYVIEEEHHEEEERPDDMPVYMADYLKIGDNFFFSYQLGEYEKQLFITEELPLSDSYDEDLIEELQDDPYSVDEIVNKCLLSGNFSLKISVLSNRVKNLSPQNLDTIKRLNWLLNKFGGVCGIIESQKISESYLPSQNSIDLLHEYWGDDASFRKLNVYADPALNKDLVSISQGKIVDILIEECDKAAKGLEYRDIFLTAPTGAGKSLLFQLPAFHVSNHNAVTIIVSPLIALMEDQVTQILNDRNFKKVAFLNSDLALTDRDRVIDQCKSGDIDIIYMAPELLLSYDLSRFLGERKLGLLVIDEAHLITTWGREFRVDYWYLGQHLNKIRKSGVYKFPIIAVTATAVFGGDNDMVNDSIKSLYLPNPHVFIGEVKRNDIRFVINNHEDFFGRFDTAKQKETVGFINAVNENNIKTIVYAPYRTHINAIEATMLKEDAYSKTAFYHAGKDSESRVHAQEKFKFNHVNTLVSTKAFGMGIDIADIQVVYHHAPSGTLADYIQEVGRVARKPNLTGFAAISYTPKELRYSKQLHGISALRHWQLREVLKKLYSIFQTNGKKRNFLVSSEDFGYIFNSDDLDQKVMTSLMMLEKDYLIKKSFNVLIARRKKLFSKVFARTNPYGFRQLSTRYPGLIQLLYKSDSYHYLSLDLDGIWQKDFCEDSFPQVKRKFFMESLFKEDNIDLVPQIKITYNLTTGWRKAFYAFADFCEVLTNIFAKFGSHVFTAGDFESEMLEFTKSKEKAKRMSKFILDAFSKHPYRKRNYDTAPFLQIRDSGEGYNVIGSVSSAFSGMKKCFSNVFENQDENQKTASCFKKFESSYHAVAMNLGCLLELLGLADFESRGGDNPMIFIRINDPYRIKSDGNFNGYKNSIITKQQRHHETSCRIFDHFFMNSMSDDERWNYIEDFFLGASEDDIFEKYPETQRNHIDLIEYIVSHCEKSEDVSIIEENKSQQAFTIFPPVDGSYYHGERLLTIDGITKKVNKWLVEDPVSLDKVMISHNIRIPKDLYDILLSKIMRKHFPYYRDSRRLNIMISDYPKQSGPVQAKSMYELDPVAFYRWWKTHRNVVTMNTQELIILLHRVNKTNPRLITKDDKDFLLGKKPLY